MRLFDFLSFFDESTMVKIVDKDEVLMECKVGEVTQKFLNCRFLIKSYIENGALFVHTEVYWHAGVVIYLAFYSVSTTIAVHILQYFAKFCILCTEITDT